MVGHKGVLVLVSAIFLMAFLALFLPRAGYAIGGVQNTSYAIESYTPVNGSIDTTGGNIYQYNLTSIDKTYRWVGLWGNITGSIQLRTTSNSFRTWPVSTVTAGSVLYATTYAEGVDPTSFSLTNVTYLNQADTAYGFNNSVTDSINYMIRRTSVEIGDESNVVWAVEVDPGQTAFNSQLADYELLLPENEEVGDGEGTITTYYLWLEFN
jgi:hypothetical protein